MPKQKKVEAVEPSYKEVALNKKYVSKRLGKTIEVYPVDVKRDVVKVKRSLEAADSRKMSRAEFDRYYVQA